MPKFALIFLEPPSSFGSSLSNYPRENFNDRITAYVWKFAPSEPLHPRPQLDLPRPGRARLLQDVHVGCGDGIGIEHAVGRSAGPNRARAFRVAHGAVDDKVSDVDAVRREF